MRDRMHKKLLAILLLLYFSASAQQYFEASGRTEVFNLTAGAHADPVAIAMGNRPTMPATPHLLVTVNHGVYLQVQNTTAKALVSIYNIVGKRILEIGIDGKSLVALSKNLPSGVYFARLEIQGAAMQTVRFRMVR
jgi:hypothetical protein